MCLEPSLIMKKISFKIRKELRERPHKNIFEKGECQCPLSKFLLPQGEQWEFVHQSCEGSSKRIKETVTYKTGEKCAYLVFHERGMREKMNCLHRSLGFRITVACSNITKPAPLVQGKQKWGLKGFLHVYFPAKAFFHYNIFFICYPLTFGYTDSL